MRPTVNIAILGGQLVYWGGGIDLLRTLLNAVCAAPRDATACYLLLPREDWKYQTFLRVSRARDIVSGLLSASGHRPTERTRYTDAQLKSVFACYEDRLTVIFYDDNRAGLLASLKEIRADVVFPSMKSLGKQFPVPWIGYILDFQHRHLPHLFSWLEREYRRWSFNALLRDAATILVNGRAVKTDALAFYPRTRANIIALPFAPSVRAEWLKADPREARSRHGIAGRYFIVCNQFWIHKDHKTAFRAFALFVAARPDGDAPIYLVCTGGLHDYRAPAYLNEIKMLLSQLGISRSVHLLGHIPKEDQIALVRGAIAVIQPTLFEGGPGGGSIYDAVALGVPGLVSDIPINREIDDPNINYFAPGEPGELAQLMLAALRTPRRPLDDATLMSRSDDRLRTLGKTLDSAVAAALSAQGRNARA